MVIRWKKRVNNVSNGNENTSQMFINTWHFYVCEITETLVLYVVDRESVPENFEN